MCTIIEEASPNLISRSDSPQSPILSLFTNQRSYKEHHVTDIRFSLKVLYLVVSNNTNKQDIITQLSTDSPSKSYTLVTQYE
jgi:hypothetical protein